MKFTRRGFIASAFLPALAVPAMVAAHRAAFVEVGDDVSFLYFEDWTRPVYPCTISAFVERVGEWNGSFYPIILSEYRHSGRIYWDSSDAEWCMFRKEIPEFRWNMAGACRYPNIHAYVREKRFGEDPRLMSQQMERNMLHRDTLTFLQRGSVPTRSTVLV